MDPGYRVRAVRAPRLAGWRLRGLAALVERPVLGWALRRIMVARMGVPELRRIHAEEGMVLATPMGAIAAVGDGPAGELAAVTHDAAVETAADFVDAYRGGSITPVEVAERFLAAAEESERIEPPLRAFLAIDRDDLMAQARASAQRYREGHPLGLLDGVPVAVKDELDQAGYRTTVGTRFLGRRVADGDATVVGRLRAAGALLVGKTNMHEVGLGTTGINPHHGPTRNPHDTGRITGGSSSGSAAAVAAGLCPIAVGADGGGSIRIPSALCGIVGLKPTFGRISGHGAAPICWSVGQVGPMAATACDAALAYMAMAGPDAADPNTLRQPAPVAPDLANRDVQGLRIGVYRPWFDDADPTVVATCDGVLAELRSRGARVVEVKIAHLEIVRQVHAVTIVLEMADAFAKQRAEEPAVFGADVRLTLALASALRPTDYIHAQRLRRRICEAMAAAMAGVDVIATPTTGTTAAPIHADAAQFGESDFELMDRMMRFAALPNLTGHPAITLPAGHDANGLPIGLQFIAHPWREDLLLRLGAVCESFVQREPAKVRWRLMGM